MPYNLVMTEAFALQNQQVGQEFFSPIEAAQQLGLTVMVSATLKQGLLATPFMADLSPYFPGAQTDAQKAVQFVRSTPGVASALVGMSRVEHVEEILALHRLRPIDGDTIRGMFEP
jgi:aryl-alcohol dehydrogenase-like predicted oxidoreductase